MTKKRTKNNFENNISRLEEISKLLESEELGLDDAISLFEEGIKLSKSSIAALKNAELKVTELKKELSDFTSGKAENINEE